MTTRRSDIVDASNPGVYHCVSRCVRRESLIDDPERREWIVARLDFLTRFMAIDVISFAVMRNHIHLLLAIRPEIVGCWSDREVAERRMAVLPRKRKRGRNSVTPAGDQYAIELAAVLASPKCLANARRDLSNLGFFHRLLKEPCARTWNKADGVTGHFWEGRFKAQPLLDQTAIAACMVYVDLNPIRAGIAKTPETSDFTSVKERVADRQSSQAVSAVDAQDARIEHGPQAGWLAPVPLDPPRKKVREKLSPRRASNKGCLAMSLDQYLQLLDWTGRQLRSDKRGSLPKGLDPMLERLQCSSETWLDLVKNFRKRFRVEIGLPATLQSVSSLRRTNRKAAQA